MSKNQKPEAPRPWEESPWVESYKALSRPVIKENLHDKAWELYRRTCELADKDKERRHCGVLSGALSYYMEWDKWKDRDWPR